jgi:hypothetical protein
VARSLYILAATAFTCLTLALVPAFAPENLFVRTQSRLQIPTDVLFTRLTALRPNGALTAADTTLRAKFVNLESRLLYLQFGPDVLASCPFCNSDDPRSYFYYAIPELLAPHLRNLLALSAATSGFVTGASASATRWRALAVMAAVAAAALDVYLVSSYNYQGNARATRLAELDPFYWRARRLRLLGLAALDGALAALVWLAGTNRAFARPASAAERVEAVTRALVGGTKAKLSALGIVKNTAIRDEELRDRLTAYWRTEGRLMREAMEEREVVAGVRDALSERIRIADITRDAETYAATMLPQPPTPAADAKEAETGSGRGTGTTTPVPEPVVVG